VKRQATSPPTERRPRARPAARTAAEAFEYADGVRLGAAPLWFDAPRRRESVVVTHAGARLAPRCARSIATPRTLALRAALGTREEAAEALAVPCGRPFALGQARIELFSSGYLAGASSCLVEIGGKRAIYAGRVCPAHGPTAEPMELRRAEVLAIDCSLAAIEAEFLSWPAVEETVGHFVARTLAAGQTPVLLAPWLGVAQDLCAWLASRGHALCAHARIHAACAAFRAAGVPLPEVRRLGRPRQGEVVLWPEEAHDHRVLRAFAGTQIAWVSPCAIHADARRDVRCHEAHAIGTHADQAALLDYVEATGASLVYLVGGPTGELVHALAARGVGARPLGPPQQLGLWS
jgi:hypothetical protein